MVGRQRPLDEAVSGSRLDRRAVRAGCWPKAELGGERQASTTVAVFNQGAATDVAVTLLFEDGAGSDGDVPGCRRGPVRRADGGGVPDAAEGRRSRCSSRAPTPTANLIVDRAIFWQSAGANRTAGADGAATRLR